MKRLSCIIIIVCLFAVVDSLSAQGAIPWQRKPEVSNGVRERKNEVKTPELSVRAKELNRRMTQKLGNLRWKRVIYRKIDLRKEQNAVLYYPERPVNNMRNLFSTIFRLMAENKLVVYEYIPDYELFDEDHIVDFKDVLKRAYISCEEIAYRVGESATYKVRDIDIPSEDVLAYYVKEIWYYDQNNSVFSVKIEAICPILSITDDVGLSQTIALFWLPYENIRPYIFYSTLMTSGLNSAETYTIDDYFHLRLYDGEIIKTENPLNKTLCELYLKPDLLKSAQEEIERQLIEVEGSFRRQAKPVQNKIEKTGAKKNNQEKSSRNRMLKSSKYIVPIASVRDD